MSKTYVSAFPGFRDQYQLVSSLWEHNRLDGFITDLYNKGLVATMANRTGRGDVLGKRTIAGMPDRLVHTRPGYLLAGKVMSKYIQRSKVSVWMDDWYARAAVDLAARKRSNLFLYEFQAEYAFRQKAAAGMNKMLFHFHPHPGWEHPVLMKDVEQYPGFRQQVLANTRNNLADKYRLHVHSAWEHATHIVVASGITKKSLVAVGCPENRITVVPYGFSAVDTTLNDTLQQRRPEKPFFLFVGSGTHRKGLHHLSMAWQKAGLSDTFDLVVIARTIDAAMAPYLAPSTGIKWINGVSKMELTWYFQRAHSFVMPSLSEGFGQVYLEALANGCAIIGTAHSMLPDIKGVAAHSVLTTPGDIEELIHHLQQVSQKSPTDIFFNKEMIRQLVKPYNWQHFRTGINDTLAEFD